VFRITELRERPELVKGFKRLCLLIDRFKIARGEEFENRIADSVKTAFFEGRGACVVKVFDRQPPTVEEFRNRFEADGIEFQEPTPELFNFNSPLGACPVCNGFGNIIGIDEDLVIPDKNRSIYQDAVAPWRGPKLQYYKNLLVRNAHKFNFPVHTPYKDLTDEQKKLLWEGNRYFVGINEFFRMLERENHKVQNRVMLSRYRAKTVCPACKGTRLRKEAGYVKVGGKSIQELVLMQVKDLRKWFEQLQLNEYEMKVAGGLLAEIRTRLQYLDDIGLGYLTLNRASNTLSGGETQRINLATALGSSLQGSLYILDEPTVGLHPRDTQRLTAILRRLQQIGNTVLVVEHDETVIREADFIVDLGPGAGVFGGEVVFAGTPQEFEKSDTLTAQYLTGKKKIPVPKVRRKPSAHKGFIEIHDAYQHNLKHLNVRFPLGLMTVVTGVSGSGKSSLVVDVLYSAVAHHLGDYSRPLGKFGSLSGDLDKIDSVQLVDQNPIGRSSRSNPATYIKDYDWIRKLFAQQPTAKVYGFTPSHFSFNVEGGRCEVCQGEGVIRVEMQFMPDVELICEACGGKRFKEEVLEVTYRGKNIYDVLEMTIDEAISFFQPQDDSPQATLERNIIERLQLLQRVELGYLKLGQSLSTLSGGESQRLKLASFLQAEQAGKHTLFIFDEPTTGLHFDDVRKLLAALNQLIDRGNTVVIIEHNLDVIKSADWVIDLGPEGGNEGGQIICQGTPEQIAQCSESYTGKFLRHIFT
jgi:excinuclease ABC subunit A